MQNDIAPKSSLITGDFASGFCFSKKSLQVKSAAVADFSCKGQPTNLAGPLDHPNEPNFHPCKPDKNAVTAISLFIWVLGMKFRKQTDIIFRF